jgi:hypothetical protein
MAMAIFIEKYYLYKLYSALFWKNKNSSKGKMTSGTPEK